MFVYPPPTPPAPVIPPITAIEKEGLKIEFAFERDGLTSNADIQMRATNFTGSLFENFLFEAAVPKVSLSYLCNYLSP